LTVLALFYEWEPLSGQELKNVRSDNGKEFVNKEFNDYVHKHGIFHETTAPYAPERNS
jgi:hypothetical protein